MNRKYTPGILSMFDQIIEQLHTNGIVDPKKYPKWYFETLYEERWINKPETVDNGIIISISPSPSFETLYKRGSFSSQH